MNIRKQIEIEKNNIKTLEYLIYDDNIIPSNTLLHYIENEKILCINTVKSIMRFEKIKKITNKII